MLKGDVLRVGAPDGSQVVLHVPTGTYLKLDRSAALILELLAETGKPDAAAARLAERVEIPLRRAEEDVRSVVSSLDRLQRQVPRRPRRPGVRTTAHEIRAWWTLPIRARWAVAQVVVALCAVEIGLRVLNVQRTARLFRTPLAGPGVGGEVTGSSGPGGQRVEYAPVPPGDPGQLRPSEQRVLRAIDWVAVRWLNPVTCLRWALITGFFLRRRRPVLRLGLMADGLTAHAWVEAEGGGWGMEDVVGTFQPVC